ncbi:MAG TPA: hypothetical protein VFE31_10375 [Opitutaceae bacterium]|jgi:hypothetical protein|nr:hypothetical protein [Opitutaceae bacterium]
MRSCRLLPVLALGATVHAAADPHLAHVWRARRLLGPETWARALRIANRAPGRYPAEVDALVFELEGALWFYTDADGTQSLSQYLNRTERDKADLGPLLRAIEPGFAAWEDAPPCLEDSVAGALPNGCFIQSLGLLRERRMAGLALARPRLLSYYVQTPGGLRGHTVLQFREGDAWRVVDPLRPKARLVIHPRNPDDPRACAIQLRPDVASARFLPLDGAFPAIQPVPLQRPGRRTQPVPVHPSDCTLAVTNRGGAGHAGCCATRW